jgi:hypothetical protein
MRGEIFPHNFGFVECCINIKFQKIVLSQKSIAVVVEFFEQIFHAIIACFTEVVGTGVDKISASLGIHPSSCVGEHMKPRFKNMDQPRNDFTFTVNQVRFSNWGYGTLCGQQCLICSESYFMDCFSIFRISDFSRQ